MPVLLPGVDPATALPPLAALLVALTLALLSRRVTPAARLDRRLRRMLGLRDTVARKPKLHERLARFEGMLIGGPTDRREIGEYLRAAGYYGVGAQLVFALVRLLATAVALGGSLALFSYFGWLTGRARFAPFMIAAFTYLSAKRVLKVRASAREKRIRGELPFLLDLLRLMLEAGSSLDQCFRNLARAEVGSVVPETQAALKVMVDDLSKGTSYEQALTRWGDRLGVDGARELAALFKQALLHGTEIAEALTAFTAEAADRRLNAAREAVGKKAAQLSGAMMLFFVPALFILLGGPAAMSLSAALHGISK
jgi:tight adherence protein C